VIPAVHRRGPSGPTLVCHPGGPGLSARYFGELAGLSEHLELILVDPRGTGATPRPVDRRAYAIADYVDDLEELREALGLARLNLLGHSHGGIIAAAYAAAHAQRVERLVLASTLARFHTEQEEAMRQGLERSHDEPWHADAVAALNAETAGSFSSDEELRDLVFRELRLYFARYGEAERRYLENFADELPNGDALLLFNTEIAGTFDLRPQLSQIEADTLVITGELDFITGPVCSRELADQIAGAQETVLPNAGHFVFTEAPDAFREAVVSFLEKGPPQPCAV
jgi:proline-specific peptidase